MAEARPSSLVMVSPEKAKRAIDDWFRRGYVMFSDLETQSTRLRRAQTSEGAPRPRRGRSDAAATGRRRRVSR